MIAIQHLKPGTRLGLADGALAEIHENPRDGTWVIVRRLSPEGAASETDDLVHVDDITEVIAG